MNYPTPDGLGVLIGPPNVFGHFKEQTYVYGHFYLDAIRT
jgi:hypothetical protein